MIRYLPLTLSLAATLEWRRRSHVKGVRRPSAANYSDLLNFGLLDRIDYFLNR